MSTRHFLVSIKYPNKIKRRPTVPEVRADLAYYDGNGTPGQWGVKVRRMTAAQAAKLSALKEPK